MLTASNSTRYSRQTRHRTDLNDDRRAIDDDPFSPRPDLRHNGADNARLVSPRSAFVLLEVLHAWAWMDFLPVPSRGRAHLPPLSIAPSLLIDGVKEPHLCRGLI